MIGEVIGGNYRILEKVGQGGMGEVYRGLDLLLDRQVAIKVLHPELERAADVVDRFCREAVTLAKLNHPHVATLYAFLKEAERHFMIMEFAQGRTLDRCIADSELGLPYRQVVSIVIQVLNALACAHGQGIIHRDLKPSNVMVTDNGAVKVMDFGIARVLGADRITRTGFMVGTVKYMSPEQICGLESDERSDLYSLGIVMFELLTGNLPFRTPSDYEILKAHVELPPEPIRTYVDHVPPLLEAIVMRALAKDPADRFPSAEVFLAELLEAVDDDKTMLVQASKTLPVVDLKAPAGEPRPKIRGGRQRSRIRGTLLLVAALAALGTPAGRWLMRVMPKSPPLIVQQGPSVEEERYGQLVAEGRAALAANRLTSPDQNNAVDYAVQAMRLRADGQEARELVEQVARRKLAEAESALIGGDPDRAQQLLATASELQRQFALTLNTVELAARIAAGVSAVPGIPEVAPPAKAPVPTDVAVPKPIRKARPAGHNRAFNDGYSKAEAQRREEERRAEERFVEERNQRELRQASERATAEAKGPDALQRWEERVRAEEARAEQAYHEERARRSGARPPAPESSDATPQEASP